jgi:hypothetical protein
VVKCVWVRIHCGAVFVIIVIVVIIIIIIIIIIIRLAWLKTIDDNLRTQPKHFWKYISKFKSNEQSVTQM